ncbi:MAG: rane-bound lytic murein transglycosylase [Bacteroidetes bacterium]|nr:rane-bound lytic murein transglycosylase [Bacteroidota bacterium]
MVRLKESVLLLLVSVAVVGCLQTPSTSEIVGRPDLAVDADVQSVQIQSVSAGGEKFAPVVRKYAEKFGVDWVLVLAVMHQESRFNRNALSHKGAFGLMQIMPQTRLELEEKLGVDETLTPRNNIRAGIYHLKRLSKSFSSSSIIGRTSRLVCSYKVSFLLIVSSA